MKAAPLLVGSVFGSLIASSVILYPLHPEDRISPVQGVCLMGLGFIFFISLLDLSNYFMFHTASGRKLVKKYKLGLYDIMDISNKVVSAVQAVLSSLCGTIVCNFSCPRNMLRTSHFMSQAYAWFGASYFLYDVYSMFVIHNLSPKTISRLNTNTKLAKGNENHSSQVNKASHFSKVKDFVVHQPVIVIHHLFIGLFGFLVVVHLRKNFGDCVFGFIFLMELSTPFVSFRRILSKLQLKQSKLYVINGIVMITVFFVCRIFLFIWLFRYYSQFIEANIVEAIWTLPTVCRISLLILIFPQLYWFTIMLKGAFSLFVSHVKSSSIASPKLSMTDGDAASQLAGVNGRHSNRSMPSKVH